MPINRVTLFETECDVCRVQDNTADTEQGARTLARQSGWFISAKFAIFLCPGCRADRERTQKERANHLRLINGGKP